MNILPCKIDLYFENSDSNTQKIQLKINDLKNIGTNICNF